MGSLETPVTSSIVRGPGRLGEKKDELQLVIDNIKAGQLKLADYLLEMFERASMYFQQIGARQLPEYKAKQIMELHDMALQVLFPNNALLSFDSELLVLVLLGLFS